jgi:hypothetical protein
MWTVLILCLQKRHFNLDYNTEQTVLYIRDPQPVPWHSGVPIHGIRYAANCYKKQYLNTATFTALNLFYVILIKNLKYLFASICAFQTYTVGYEVYHHPPCLLTSIHSAGRECKLILLN